VKQAKTWDGGRVLKEGKVPTPSENEVMQLIAEGITDLAIARRLGVSVVTIRKRARRFRLRIGARNRTHAVAIGVSRGWLKVDQASSED
jgi:DNA-binding NarL/FixJ family response regulator